MYRNFRSIIAKWSESLPTPRDLSPTYFGYVAYDFDMYEDFKGYEDFSKAQKRELAFH